MAARFATRLFRLTLLRALWLNASAQRIRGVSLVNRSRSAVASVSRSRPFVSRMVRQACSPLMTRSCSAAFKEAQGLTSKPSSKSWARTNARNCQSAAIKKILPTYLLYHVPRRISSPGWTTRVSCPYAPITGASRFAYRSPMGYNRLIMFFELTSSLDRVHTMTDVKPRPPRRRSGRARPSAWQVEPDRCYLCGAPASDHCPQCHRLVCDADRVLLDEEMQPLFGADACTECARSASHDLARDEIQWARKRDRDQPHRTCGLCGWESQQVLPYCTRCGRPFHATKPGDRPCARCGE